MHSILVTLPVQKVFIYTLLNILSDVEAYSPADNVFIEIYVYQAGTVDIEMVLIIASSCVV